MDGAVPLRAAQACMPLLEGNALGFQVVLNRPLRLRQKLGGFAMQEETAGIKVPLAMLQKEGLDRLIAHGKVPKGDAGTRRWRKV